MSPAHRKGKRRTPQAAVPTDSSVDLTWLLGIVGAFPRQTICVAGDFVLDEFVSGEISRVSREAPVLILRHRRTEIYPGGAGNAAANLASLGARVLAVGVAGDDDGGRVLLDCLRRRGVDVSRIVRASGWVTARKTRYLAGWTHSTEQQVLRVDCEPNGTLPEATQQAIARKARQAASRASAVLVSDYGFGAATPELVRGLRAKRVTLDSRYRLLSYAKAGVVAATPNEAELEAAYHERIGTDAQKLEELGERAASELGVECLVVTRGKDGMAVFERDESTARGLATRSQHIPIYGSDAPVDVTGAGDTVIAVFTLALAAGASYLEAAHLANYAGGIVVMKRRTATLTRAELEATLRRKATAQR
ncbi:MAG TPA: PfkB family carbohydrate kinase [Candidatus Dormibacteraeota bacterium]|nr:PfkB family carbohydrate kinase [Candidatus Dormibacteraeota bacterium]